MPPAEKHAPGSFNWVELDTTDQNAAKQFYGSLFGWEARDSPIDQDRFYTMFKLDGRDVCGCYSLGEQAQAVPPHWGIFIAVEDAEATVARAEQLGGKVIDPAFDVYTFGRMAVLQDPTGAVFRLWQPKSHMGALTTGVNGAFCWADLNTPDPQHAKTFYENVFGWKIFPGKDKPADSYLHITNRDEYIGGIPPRSDRNRNAPPHWLAYFQVADCDTSTAKAKALGARVYFPPMVIENSLQFSVLADPQGAVFALFARRA